MTQFKQMYRVMIVQYAIPFATCHKTMARISTNRATLKSNMR